MTTSLYSASVFDSTWLGSSAASSSFIYKRDAVNVLNGTIDTASNLGTLRTDDTQLDLTAQVSRENPSHFYKFTLDGDNLKMAFANNTDSADLRLQILDSSGSIVADSSQAFAEEEDLLNYVTMITSSGVDLEAGDYTIKVSFEPTAKRSVPQTYSLAMYSGESFNVSYQTTAKSQTSASQVVKVDNTMTYSLIDALEYSSKSTHLANETTDTAIDIGWLAENKTALSVTSQMTDICKEQYYVLTLQQGENLKMAFNNHTDTSELRVQLYDSTGTRLLADSHGSEDLKEAYAELTSSDGFATKAGKYVVKVGYALGEEKNTQIYDFKIYSGTLYDKVYETLVATETAATAIMGGRLTDFNPKAATVSYLAAELDSGDDIIYALKKFIV